MSAPANIHEVSRNEMATLLKPFVGARELPREWGREYPAADIRQLGYCLVDARIQALTDEGIEIAGHSRGEREVMAWDEVTSVTLRHGAHSRCYVICDEPEARAAMSYVPMVQL